MSHNGKQTNNCKLCVDERIIVQTKTLLMLNEVGHALSPVYARCTFDCNLCFCDTPLLLFFANQTDTTNYLTSELPGILFACVQDLKSAVAHDVLVLNVLDLILLVQVLVVLEPFYIGSVVVECAFQQQLFVTEGTVALRQFYREMIVGRCL